MGGRSKSRQTTTNAQETTNLVNDGEFAGASNISIDESDRSVNDSNNSEYNLEQNIDEIIFYLHCLIQEKFLCNMIFLNVFLTDHH